MKKNRTIQVDRTLVSVCSVENEDYISITDMIKAKDGEFFISDWLRNRNTIEFLGVWEAIHNKDFNYGEFAIIKSQAGLNSYKISVKEWNEKTNAIGLCAKTGRYGGTYAHRDIAFEFGTWISPEFKLYLLLEFQRLKEQESDTLLWDFRRSLTSTNYRVQTDAIKEYLIPFAYLNKKPDSVIYIQEAELINYAVFGLTSVQWRQQFPAESNYCKTIRDCADTHLLIALSTAEAINAMLIRDGMPHDERLIKLRSEVLAQLQSLKRLSSSFAKIKSPHRKKALEEKKDLTMTFGEAIRKISKAGKPKPNKEN